MTYYYAKMGYGSYTTDEPGDLEPYPDDWLDTQKAGSVRSPPF